MLVMFTPKGLGHFKVTLIRLTSGPLEKMPQFNVRFSDNFSNHFHENEENFQLMSGNIVDFETFL